MGILLLWILAAALVAYSLMLVFLSNFNMGNPDGLGADGCHHGLRHLA